MTSDEVLTSVNGDGGHVWRGHPFPDLHWVKKILTSAQKRSKAVFPYLARFTNSKINSSLNRLKSFIIRKIIL